MITLYRERAATETLYELRRHPDATRYTYLAAFCQQRTAEVTDSLVDLLLLVIHRIGAKAEKHVKQAVSLTRCKRVEDKPRLLHQMAEAALAQPERDYSRRHFSRHERREMQSHCQGVQGEGRVSAAGVSEDALLLS